MITTGHLAKFLLSLDPRKDAGRMALYHYLLHVGPLRSPLSSQIISDFVEFALVHEHWQTHSQELQAEMELSLQRFSETYRVRFDWTNILWPLENQVIKVKDPVQIELVLQNQENRKGQKLKFFRNREEHVVAITHEESGSLQVEVFPNLLRLYRGQLFPLKSQSLIYDTHLNLEENRLQQIQADTHSYALFRKTEQGWEGKILRGYSLQSLMTIEGPEISRYPALFYPVKRLEQFFIHRRSDPMYLELVQTLEKSIQLIRDGHPEAIRYATACYERGRTAFEEIFPDDKLLGIALNSLEALLASPGSTAQAESIL